MGRLWHHIVKSLECQPGEQVFSFMGRGDLEEEREVKRRKLHLLYQGY